MRCVASPPRNFFKLCQGSFQFENSLDRWSERGRCPLPDLFSLTPDLFSLALTCSP
jgi:hypothetical protein